MSGYYLILLWILFIGILSMILSVKREEKVCGEVKTCYTPYWATIVFLPLIIWSGYRGYVGDTYAYMQSFAEMPSSFSLIPKYMSTVNKDEGFYFLSALIKSIVHEHVEIYFIIIAALQGYFLVRIYRKYSGNYVMSIFLFIVSTDYISWMFNGMRQFTAVTITLLCFEFAIEKKYVRAILVALLASTIHGSALLVIPFLFVAQGKAWNIKTLLFIVAIIVVVAYVEEFTGILDTVLAETQYENVVSDWKNWQDDGTNFLRVVVYAIPTIISLLGIRYIRKDDNLIINMCVNMSIVSTGLYIVSMVTSGLFIGRLPIYFSIYNYILLPWEIERMFTKRSVYFIYAAMIAAYFVFYYLQIKVIWGLV